MTPGQSVDVNQQEPTIRGAYRHLREEGQSRVMALVFTPILWFIAGFAIAALRHEQREKARVQREERWRQEVRDNE